MRSDEPDQLMSIVALTPVRSADEQEFTLMAERHFTELNPGFIAHPDWKAGYFQSILQNPNMTLEWVMASDRRVGFILFGLEPHRFLPRKSGVIYELYIDPSFRRRGFARTSALEAIKRLRAENPSKLQLEIMDGNVSAELLWKSFGFRKVCERWVLGQGAF